MGLAVSGLRPAPCNPRMEHCDDSVPGGSSKF